MGDDPHCPFVSRAARRVLTVRFAVLVDADGRVLDAHVTLPSGREPEHLVLDGALVEALRTDGHASACRFSGAGHGLCLSVTRPVCKASTIAS